LEASVKLALALAALCALATAAQAEDGYDLWLRYQPLEKQVLSRYRAAATAVVTAGHSATSSATRDELVRGLSGLLARKEPIDDAIRRDGVLLVGTPAVSPTIAKLNLPLDRVGDEGFVIRSVIAKGRKAIVIAANSDVGALHGAFAFLRLLQTRQPLDRLDIVSAPKVKLRLLNHWDNLDRTMERGFSGFSIFNWWELPNHVSPQITDYARANASLGLNGTLLTNPSGLTTAISMTGPWLKKAAALADVLRPYGIKVYLTARFSLPVEIGGLKTSDPLDPGVRQFWKDKADEIYRIIPDFGGFVVKANSEGQPGPQDFGRTHADGANMMAEALAPHGGIVIWRAFVYSPQPEDRIKQAYNEFKPLDGKFADNVIIQVKNGPLDYQPREPFSPLFGALPKTNTAIELQTTKEYLGFEIHLVYLGTMWQEVLQSDTYANGPGTTVAKVVDGQAFGNKLTLMSGIANTGTARNWSGSIFDQANWYAFGRLAWDPDLGAEAIANEWVRMTFTNAPAFVKPVVAMMMGSRETAVDYMTPLGLAHQMATSHHYGPGPWVDDAGRADWNPVYFSQADKGGIGFDRTPSGSNAVAQYAPPLAAQFSDPQKTPERLLLWFHHEPWTYQMKSGRTLWDELVLHYAHGVENVGKMNDCWAMMKPYVDAERFTLTADFLRQQEEDAKIWRDASIAYFQSLSGLPLPAGVTPPEHTLDYYKALRQPFAPGSPGKTASPFRND
jgi:alpha-glucuronidase